MKRIKDLRTRGIGTHGVRADASVGDAVREFLDKNVSALIVYDDHKMVGIFTKNDLVRACGASPNSVQDLKVAEYMKTDVFTTTVDANLDDVMTIMIEKGFRHVPVLEGDTVVGMVTSMDILMIQASELGYERDELMRYIRGSY